jgi:hypothetical protein
MEGMKCSVKREFSEMGFPKTVSVREMKAKENTEAAETK